MRTLAVATFATTLLLGNAAVGQQAPDWRYPAITGAGPVVPVPDATPQFEGAPYEVVFNITQDRPGDGRVSPGLASVARFVNLLAMSDMDPAASDLVAVLHGPATAAVISNDAYVARFGAQNPNIELIRQLEDAGVEVVVCGQAVAGAGFSYEAVLEPVEISVSAMTELAQRQMQGYALVPG
ncbi:DsrE family protein [Salinarimonas ramus]|uniref:Intracellular sulfur oxidation DsrE/DsrF family protein n=1 Tax=Salinarimonas ramus TaxID=690164 RepID=A0A917QKF3_9HYPH|nr:DsrE family protein [Salinarimonas ramus]GGK54645.1 hypothetical protein GCM10011322_46780 [Salinarimonas ramus]